MYYVVMVGAGQHALEVPAATAGMALKIVFQMQQLDTVISELRTINGQAVPVWEVVRIAEDEDRSRRAGVPSGSANHACGAAQ